MRLTSGRTLTTDYTDRRARPMPVDQMVHRARRTARLRSRSRRPPAMNSTSSARIQHQSPVGASKQHSGTRRQDAVPDGPHRKMPKAAGTALGTTWGRSNDPAHYHGHRHQHWRQHRLCRAGEAVSACRSPRSSWYSTARPARPEVTGTSHRFLPRNALSTRTDTHGWPASNAAGRGLRLD